MLASLGVGHGLNLVEPVSESLFLAAPFLVFSPLQVAELGVIVAVEGVASGGDRGQGTHADVRRDDAASLPRRMIIIPASVDGFPAHFTLHSRVCSAWFPSRILGPNCLEW